MSQHRRNGARQWFAGARASEAAGVAKPEVCPVPRAARRIGAAAFLFFLIKGLLWLTVPAALAVWRGWFGG